MGLEADVAAAVDYLRQRAATLNIVVIGSSIGGTAAALYAARAGAPVRGLGLISPGIAYRGIDLRAPLQTYLSGRATTPAGLPRVRLFTASGDTYSADTTQSLETQLSAPDGGASLLVAQRYEGTSAHGVSLGADGVHPELWTQLDAWVRGFDR
jgi:pimeloyl-ACP methyl ester carboxylesterase